MLILMKTYPLLLLVMFVLGCRMRASLGGDTTIQLFHLGGKVSFTVGNSSSLRLTRSAVADPSNSDIARGQIHKLRINSPLRGTWYDEEYLYPKLIGRFTGTIITALWNPGIIAACQTGQRKKFEKPSDTGNGNGGTRRIPKGERRHVPVDVTVMVTTLSCPDGCCNGQPRAVSSPWHHDGFF